MWCKRPVEGIPDAHPHFWPEPTTITMRTLTGLWVFVDSVNSGQVNVIVLTHNGSGPQDGGFYFIAAGPR